MCNFPLIFENYDRPTNLRGHREVKLPISASCHLLVLRLEEPADELEAAHEASDHVARVLGVPDTRGEGPGRGGLEQ